MLRRRLRPGSALLIATAALTVGVTISSAEARQPWPLAADDRDGPCALDITGNGKFFRIGLSGLEPGERANFLLTNEDIRPIRFTFAADQAGQWEKFYLPFLWSHRGGTVAVNIDGAGCAVGASFTWTRDIAY